jgi:hypothetical protein
VRILARILGGILDLSYDPPIDHGHECGAKKLLHLRLECWVLIKILITWRECALAIVLYAIVWPSFRGHASFASTNSSIVYCVFHNKEVLKCYETYDNEASISHTFLSTAPLFLASSSTSVS